MKKVMYEVRWTILLTILFGVFISSSMTDRVSEAYNSWYDKTHPVVKMEGELISRTGSSVTIHIKGEKLRQCRFVSLHAHAVKNGESIDAYKERLGLMEDGSNKQVGKHDLGRWLVWPINDADTITMTVLHDCEGRLLAAKIAKVEL